MKWMRKKKSINGLIKKFPIIYQFCKDDLNKFVLLLKKVFMLIKIWIAGKNLMKQHYQIKKAFCSKLNLEDVTDKDYAHAQKVWEVFETKDRGEYRDSYVQCDTLLLADVFGKFRDKCIEIHKLDPAHFLSVAGLAWQACLKKTGVKLEL